MPFLDLFSKTKSNGLPPHLPCGCAINLLPGTMPPHCRIYSLSQAEQKAIEMYLQGALNQQYVLPSISPASAGFFFVEKISGGLCPCIDYHSLNQISVKYTYSLPLVSSALEQVQSAPIFTKLDLRSAFNLLPLCAGDE